MIIIPHWLWSAVNNLQLCLNKCGVAFLLHGLKCLCIFNTLCTFVPFAYEKEIITFLVDLFWSVFLQCADKFSYMFLFLTFIFITVFRYFHYLHYGHAPYTPRLPKYSINRFWNLSMIEIRNCQKCPSLRPASKATLLPGSGNSLP